MAGPFKMKNPLLAHSAKTGEPMAGNFASPARHGVVGGDGKKSYRGHSHKGMSLSQRLGLSKEPLKIEEDVKEFAGGVKEDIIDPVTNVTQKIGDDIASNVSQVGSKLTKGKKKLESTTQKMGDKVVGDVKQAKSDLESFTQGAGDQIKGDLGKLHRVLQGTRKYNKETKTWEDTDSPAKHRIGRHPAKDGHVRADHPKRRQTKKDTKLVKKSYDKDGNVIISRNDDIKTVRSGGKKGDKTVKDSKKIRDAQNRINIDAGSTVRHTRKTILGIPIGKYKKTNIK